MRICTSVCVSAHRFARDDRMTRWAVINELSTEHFWPSGKRVPWWSQPVLGHRGRGSPAQRALCLCQDSPEDSCTGPAHLDNTRLVTALHLSVLTQKSPDNIISLAWKSNILIIISNYSTTSCTMSRGNNRRIQLLQIAAVLQNYTDAGIMIC